MLIIFNNFASQKVQKSFSLKNSSCLQEFSNKKIQMECNYKSLQPHKPSLHKKVDSQYFDFQFPTRLFLTKKFRHPNDIGIDLIRIGVKMYFYRGRLYNRDDYESMSGYKVIFTCKHQQCEAKLSYHKATNQQFFTCIVFQNFHQHKKSPDPQKSKKQEINQFILHLRGELYEQCRKIPTWVNKFDLPNTQAMYIVEQVYWYNNTEDQTLTTLAYQGKVVRRLAQISYSNSHQNKQTVLIFIRTQSMKKNFLLYGQTLTMQIYQQKIKKKRLALCKDHSVGYFFTQDENFKIALVGIFIISKKTPAVFKKLFQIFFETTCEGHIPFCINTDKNDQVTEALQTLKKQKLYQYNHIYPWYYMVPHLRTHIKEQNLKNGKNVMDLMCKAMQENNQALFYQTMCCLKTQLKNNKNLFEQFTKYQKYYSYRRIPQVFSGYTISTSFGEQISKNVRNSAVYRAHTGRFFHRLLKIQEYLLAQASKVTKINQVYIKYCPIQINQLIYKMQQKPMQLLLQLYNSSRDLKKQYIDPITIKVTQKEQKSYLVKFSIQFDHWQCQCRQLVLNGLPCSHLITVILDPICKGSLLYYINTRWIHDRQDQMNKGLSGCFITNKRRYHS